MPLNIITKLKTKKFFILNTEDYYLRKNYYKIKLFIKHKLEINYLKKSNGNGPKVFDSEAFSSY